MYEDEEASLSIVYEDEEASLPIESSSFSNMIMFEKEEASSSIPPTPCRYCPGRRGSGRRRIVRRVGVVDGGDEAPLLPSNATLAGMSDG